MIQIVERDFENFFQTPFAIRGTQSLYASPFKPDLKKMLSDKNPTFTSDDDFTYFTALDGNKPVGRITAHVHREYNKKFNDRKGYFGFFECVNDRAIANQLFSLTENGYAQKDALPYREISISRPCRKWG